MCAKYIALTGATGLLGSYLLKDMLGAGLPVAVFVRSDKMADAQRRIDSVLYRFEKQGGVPLARPIVFESDLGKPGLGLSADDNDWVKRHVDTMLHNAASLEFIHDEKTDEPYRTNVRGTNHVLEFCREHNIRKFHHVSTAYVCGLRNGTVYEKELDCGQTFGNAYEESKLTSETAVRRADFLDSVTVYRPAIIVGDSRTGYTPTYHGFYTPLKILYPLINAEDVTSEGIAEMIASLGMNGCDEKNFVPVDWISQVMTHIITNPKHHGNCYHLSPSNRTRIDVMSDVLGEMLIKSGNNKTLQAGHSDINVGSMVETFVKQMHVYRAYWRNDPEFDRTNTLEVAGHIPCPVMDIDRLRILAQYAVDSNFGWPRQKPVTREFNAGRFLEDRLSKIIGCQCGVDEIGLQITGLGGGDWTIGQKRNGSEPLLPGLPVDDVPMARLSIELFRSMSRGEVSPAQVTPGDIAWENANDAWVQQFGIPFLQLLTVS